MSIKNQEVTVKEYFVTCNICGTELHGPYDHCGPGARYGTEEAARADMLREGWECIQPYMGLHREVTICKNCLDNVRGNKT